MNEDGQTPILGGVLCGGGSTRFGSDKAVARAGSMLMGQRVVTALRDGGVDPVAAIGGTAGTDLGIPTVVDLRPGLGPLAGLAAALAWARPYRVVVAPCDAVLLSGAHVAAVIDRVRSLEEAEDRRGPRTAVVATVEGVPQISLACWPGEWSRDVLRMIDDGRRRFMDALDGRSWVGVELDPAAVTDADTPDELFRLLPRIDETKTGDSSIPPRN